MLYEIKQFTIITPLERCGQLLSTKLLFPFMPDILQDTVHNARQWKEGFSDMHPHGHISWWVNDSATKFTLTSEPWQK